MDSLFPISPGASCGSPYSDVTSGSVYSDALGEPVSPDYNIDNLQAQFSVQSSTSSDIPAEDSVPEDDKRALSEYAFYHGLVVGSSGAVESHLEHLINKYSAGMLGLPSRNITSGSLTPYSDVAQPKKRNREGGVKRPMNAFMCFAKAERGHLMAGQPELHNARISKHLGDVWKRCPEALKTPYIDMAQWLKELHRLENPEYKYRPRKRKASGNNNNNSKKNDNNTTTTPVTDAAASAASQGYVIEELPKPAKRARKSGGTRAPRSRATRKPSGQAAQLVPSTTLVKAPAVNADLNANAVMMPLPALEPEVAAPASVLAAAVVAVAASPLGAVEQQHPSGLLMEDNWQGSALLVPDNVDLSMFEPVDQEYLMQTLDCNMPGFLSDQYGFNVSSDKLLQGPHLEAALDGFSGELDLESLLS